MHQNAILVEFGICQLSPAQHMPTHPTPLFQRVFGSHIWFISFRPVILTRTLRLCIDNNSYQISYFNSIPFAYKTLTKFQHSTPKNRFFGVFSKPPLSKDEQLKLSPIHFSHILKRCLETLQKWFHIFFPKTFFKQAHMPTLPICQVSPVSPTCIMLYNKVFWPDTESKYRTLSTYYSAKPVLCLMYR